MRYVDRLPEPEGANTDALHFGSYIHRVLELGVSSTTVDELVALADEVRGEYSISKKYDGKDLICFSNFLKFNKDLTETVGLELVYEVNITEDISQNGIIDRVVKGNDGGFLVIDYKTSKRQKSKIELYQDSQLKGYVNAISQMYSVPVSKIIAGHYYPLTNTFVHVQYSAPQIAAHNRSIVDQVWKIRKRKKDEMRPSRNDFCNWCAYKSVCPEFNDPMTCQHKIETLLEQKKEQKKK